MDKHCPQRFNCLQLKVEYIKSSLHPSITLLANNGNKSSMYSKLCCNSSVTLQSYQASTAIVLAESHPAECRHVLEPESLPELYVQSSPDWISTVGSRQNRW